MAQSSNWVTSACLKENQSEISQKSINIGLTEVDNLNLGGGGGEKKEKLTGLAHGATNPLVMLLAAQNNKLA